MRKLVVLVVLGMAAVLVFGALDVTDADARKRKRVAPPPLFNYVQCVGVTSQFCEGTPDRDMIIGTANEDQLRGGEGNDYYVGATGGLDLYTDGSTTSSDVYTFLNNQFERESITDNGGKADVIDLRNFASTDFLFAKFDSDGDGTNDDLWMHESTGSASDDLNVINHFAGSGRVEYLKFSDTTIPGGNIPELIT